MKEIRHSNNYILADILPMMDRRKADITLKYKHGMPGPELHGKNTSKDEIAMFCIGAMFDVYESASGNILFEKAFIEALEELLARSKRNLKELEDKDGKLH